MTYVVWLYSLIICLRNYNNDDEREEKTQPNKSNELKQEGDSSEIMHYI